jgi:hypothetical protein
MISWLMLVMAVLTVLPWAYAGSYVALVQSKASPRDPFMSPRIARYRAGGMLAEKFYYPLERIDRHIRTQFWTTPDCLRDDQ